MGGNLVDAFMDHGHEVTIVDVNEESAAPRIARGARFATSLEVALDTKFVVFSLPDDNVVRAVLACCPEGSLAGHIFVNTSSEVPSDVLDVERVVVEAGGSYVDSTILTYQGEVGTTYGYLTYSGDERAFRTIEQDLYALSDPPIWLGSDALVAAEIVDLVVVTSHFGFSYTPLEGIGRCVELGIDVDDYLHELTWLLPELSGIDLSVKEAKRIVAASEDVALRGVVDAMGKADVFDRFNDDWLRDTNKSVANHYTKMLTIARSGFEY